VAHSAKKETSWSYDEIQRRTEESIRKEETKRKILKKKREEKLAIKRAGGGHSIARTILSEKSQYGDDDISFNYGSNAREESSEDIDARIAREQSSRCMAKIICHECGHYHGYCAEIKEEKEKLKMLPTGDGNNTQRRNSGGLNFINTPDLSTTAKEAKILMVKFTEKGKSGPSITLKLAFEGEIRYLWVPARKSDDRYKVMLDAFGPDENNWVDERIHLVLEQDKFTEGYKTVIKVPAKESSSKGGRK
jgi:hypothetical protein